MARRSALGVDGIAALAKVAESKSAPVGSAARCRLPATVFTNPETGPDASQMLRGVSFSLVWTATMIE